MLSAEPQVLHVFAALEVEGMVNRVCRTVEVERFDAKSVAKLDVECGRRLDPLPSKLDRSVAVIVKDIRSQKAS